MKGNKYQTSVLSAFCWMLRTPSMRVFPSLSASASNRNEDRNALRSLSFYHLLRLFFESIPLEKARSCCLQATIWVQSIVLWIRERYNLTTLLSLQPKINIKESITNVLSIILFIVFKYFDHFIALIFLYKIRRYYYDQQQ